MKCHSMGIRGGVEGIKKVQLWSVESLKLEKDPSYKAVLRILRDEDKIVSWSDSKAEGRKKVWCNRDNVVDEELRLWVIKMWKRGVYLTDAIIMEKGRRLQDALNNSMSDTEQSKCKFSEGWLFAFKNRHNFRCHKSHGESGDVDHDGAMTALPSLRQLSSQYRHCDIFNADEFGLNYSAAPTTTIGPAPLPGKKKSKERITFIICANVDGSEYVPSLMIGRANRPRCFEGLTGEELGLDYDHSKKSWMNSDIFFRWLQRFDNLISLTPGRQVLLFIENCSAHRQSATLPQLAHVRVEFLPKNTTSILQPLDLKVIASVKKRYKQKVAQRAVDLIDNGITENLYKVNIREEGIWIYDIWYRIQNDIIFSCWMNSSIVDSS